MSVAPLLIVGGAALVGSFMGTKHPALFEVGANSARGRILGLRDGALYGAAAMAGETLYHMIPGFWGIVSLLFVAAFAFSGMFMGYNTEKDKSKATRGFVRGALWGLAAIFGYLAFRYLGYGDGLVTVLLGWVGGILFGGFFAGGALMDFFQGASAFGNRQNYTRDSARYGAAAALVVVSCVSVAFGDLSTLVTVVLALGSGATAGVLTARAKAAAV